jgi:hypothetical protein
MIRTITTINTFKPQSVHIHLVFVAVMSYVIGEAMARILPSRGRIGRIINPGPVSFYRATNFTIMNADEFKSSIKRNMLRSVSCAQQQLQRLKQ